MRRELAAACLVVLGGAGLVSGQDGSRPHGRDEAFRMVDAYVVSNLQESLELTDEQFVKLLPLVKRLQRQRRELVQQRIRALHEMRRALRSGTATEAQIGELLKQVKAAETEERDAVRKDMDAIDSVLSPVQQAKFRLLEVEVERRIRDAMSHLRQERARTRRKAPEPQQP